MSHTASGTARLDGWASSIVGWHYAMWGLVALGVLNAAVLPRLNGRERVAAAIVFVVLGVAYHLDVVRGRGVQRCLAKWYLSLAVVATAVVTWIDTSFTLLLFIAYPQSWMFTRTMRQGATSTVALSIAATAGIAINTGTGWRALAVVAPQMLVTMAFSLLLGWWISRIVVQSFERAELIQELERTRTELAEANHARGVASERHRVAGEIHDTLAQGFTSVIMLAQAASARCEAASVPAGVRDRLGAIEDVARQNLAEARALVAASSPADLDGARLPDAVRRLCSRFGEQGALQLTAQIDTDLPELRREQEVALLRAAQESLANVRRHARAERVGVRLERVGGEARLEVSDDGTGFDPRGVTAGYGLSMMRRRVEELGGWMSVTSAHGVGTRVEVRLPVGAGSNGVEAEAS